MKVLEVLLLFTFIEEPVSRDLIVLRIKIHGIDNLLSFIDGNVVVV